jgi:hypothetical protein
MVSQRMRFQMVQPRMGQRIPRNLVQMVLHRVKHPMPRRMSRMIPIRIPIRIPNRMTNRAPQQRTIFKLLCLSIPKLLKVMTVLETKRKKSG